MAWFKNVGPRADNSCAASVSIKSQYEQRGQHIFSVGLRIDSKVWHEYMRETFV